MPPVGIRRLGYVTTAQVSVTAKDFPWGWISGESYRRYPNKGLIPWIFGRVGVRANLREILGHSVKRGSLGIPDPRVLVEHVYNTSKVASEVIVGSLLGVTKLNK